MINEILKVAKSLVSGIAIRDLKEGDIVYIAGRDGEKIAKYRVSKLEDTKRFAYLGLVKWLATHPNDTEVGNHFFDRTGNIPGAPGAGLYLRIMGADEKYLKR